MGAMDLYASASGVDTAKVDAALQLLREAADAHRDRIVLATSMGVEDMVLTDLIARHRLPIALATLDTGALHAETCDLIARVEQHYGLRIDVYRPDAEAVIAFVDRHGDDAMRQSVSLRHACCALRKLEPLSRMLDARDAWVTGLRREQSAQRQDLRARDDDGQGRIKYSPLVDWSLRDVWSYVAQYQVPYNPLHDAFYPSIGCAPCTRAVAPGEDFRAGRWWWEQDSAKECGLHLRHAQNEETQR